MREGRSSNAETARKSRVDNIRSVPVSFVRAAGCDIAAEYESRTRHVRQM